MFPVKLTAISAFGLEAIVGRELKNLGMKDVEVFNGGAYFTGDAKSIVEANLKLRCAERIFIELSRFKATTFQELIDGVEKIKWEDWIPEGGKFPVYAKSVKSKLFSLSDIQAIGKKAIAKRLGDKYNKTWIKEISGDYNVHIHILKDEVVVNLDTTGEPLHKRGYRARFHKAPLKETLAAALVYLANWRGSTPLVDPFCGSGTILIEATLMARNIAVGLGRKFASESWKLIPEEVWKNARKKAYSEIDLDKKFTIIGFDKDPIAIEIAIENASLAGVDEDIKFSVSDIANLKIDKEYISIITNPPYGQRLEDEKIVKKISKTMGQVICPNKTWSTYVFTGYQDFENAYGKKATKNRKLYNGRLKCYYYQYFGPRPPRKK